MNKSNNTHFKQILIDVDNYNALKELSKTGDSFNMVIKMLIDGFKMEGVRIDSALRKLGIIGITCYRDRMEMGLRGEESGISIEYPVDLDYLLDAVEEEVLFQTRYYESNIQTIKGYISENLELIKGALKQIKGKLDESF